MTFRILDARVPAERAEWIALHEGWPAREVFAHPAYVERFAGPADDALAATWTDAGGRVLYPFLSRAIAAPHLAEAAAGARDLTSPYGYGGAFATGTPDAAAFWAAHAAWARTHGAISEFVRFALFPGELLDYPGEKHEKLTNVVCDLTRDEATIWSDFDHKVRKNVNRARREGVTIEVDPTGAQLDEFLRIYTGTMDRRDARRGFYFPRDFFASIARDLPGQYVFLHARHGGAIISTELALVSAHNVYSFLGGTDSAAFELRPNDLLKLELIHWAKRAGRTRFVLGGGYTPDDGIFKYKRAFAPDGLVPYFVGTRVLDPVRYDALLAAHEAHARSIDPAWTRDAGFFPAYRTELPTSGGPGP